MPSTKTVITSIVLTVASLSPCAQAAFTLTVSQSGPNVVASGSGSINTTALTNPGTASGIAGMVWPSFSFGSLITAGIGGTLNLWTGISGPASFGSGPQVFASSVSGSAIGLIANDGLYLLPSYVSGSALTASATWNNTTLAGLGLTPGTYAYTWGVGGTADSFTLVITAPPPPTPIPSTLYLIAMGIVSVAGWQVLVARRRKTA